MQTTLLFIAFILMLVSMPLLSFGTDGDEPAVWIAGLAVLTGASLVGPALRFIPVDDDDEDEEEAESDE